jgi:hypothetical protein
MRYCAGHKPRSAHSAIYRHCFASSRYSSAGGSRLAWPPARTAQHCRGIRHLSMRPWTKTLPNPIGSISQFRARGRHVRFGSKADICSAPTHVRFSPNSDRESEIPHKVMSALPPKADMCSFRCPLKANSERPAWSVPFHIPKEMELARASYVGLRRNGGCHGFWARRFALAARRSTANYHSLGVILASLASN